MTQIKQTVGVQSRQPKPNASGGSKLKRTPEAKRCRNLTAGWAVVAVTGPVPTPHPPRARVRTLRRPLPNPLPSSSRKSCLTGEPLSAEASNALALSSDTESDEDDTEDDEQTSSGEDKVVMFHSDDDF
jgi:hypothetical protein